MRNLVRDPGAEVITGLLSFSTSFLGIGIAIGALRADASNPFAIGAFVLAGLIFIVALVLSISLCLHYHRVKAQVACIGKYLRRAYQLRSEILAQANVEISEYEGVGKETHLWEIEVQEWLDENIPEFAPDFGLETISGTTSFFIYDDVNRNASAFALRLETKASNLREILRGIRM